MSPTLLLIHGWALGPGMWSEVREHLEGLPVAVVDLGFYGSPAIPAVERPVVVGHSLGFLWALRHLPRPWGGAVSVNGFPRFTAAAGYPGVAPRVLERMRRQFDRDPVAVTAEFLGRCGCREPPPGGARTERLAEGLAWLAEWDERAALDALDCPLLALAGARDPVVPPEMSEAAFARRPLCVHPQAGHLLPMQAPDWVARHLMEFAGGDR